MQPAQRRVDRLLGPFLRRIVAPEADHDFPDFAPLESGSDDLLQPRKALLERGKDCDLAARSSPGVNKLLSRLRGDLGAKGGGLAQAGFEPDRLARGGGYDTGAKQLPEAVDLGRESDLLLEEHRGVLNVPVVDRDPDVLEAERRRRAASDDLCQARVGFLDRHEHAGGRHATVREYPSDAVELVEAGRRLADGRVPREHVPQLPLDVVDRRPVFAPSGEVGEREGDLFERASRAGVVRAGDHECGLGAERIRYELDEAFPDAERLDVDEPRVGELVRERILDAREHHGRLTVRPFDPGRRLHQRDDQARRLEAEPSRELREAGHAGVARYELDVDPVRDQAAAEEPVGGVHAR